MPVGRVAKLDIDWGKSEAIKILAKSRPQSLEGRSKASSRFGLWSGASEAQVQKAVIVFARALSRS